MRAASDGYPEPGRSPRTLGVRPGIDIPVRADGLAVGGEGGMSVAPDSPGNLPEHRRPSDQGGTGKENGDDAAVLTGGPSLVSALWGLAFGASDSLA